MASRVTFAGHERVFQGDSEDKKGDQANKFHSLFDTTDAMVRRSQRGFVCPVGGGGGGIEVCQCRCEGYGFQAVYSGIGCINQRVWV